jgi:hypothetical protein
MSKLELIEVDKYRVSPEWGRKNLKIIKVKCIQKGKTLYAPTRNRKRWTSIRELFDTPRDAVMERIDGIKEEISGEAIAQKEWKDEINQCKGLLKAIKDDER